MIIMCTCGKVRYLDKRAAKRAARAFRGPRRGTLRAYRCPGGFWHLTSHPQRKAA